MLRRFISPIVEKGITNYHHKKLKYVLSDSFLHSSVLLKYWIENEKYYKETTTFFSKLQVDAWFVVSSKRKVACLAIRV